MNHSDPEKLPILFCLIIDIPKENNNTDCEIYLNETINYSNCFRCKKPGRYMFPYDSGLGICIFLWLFTVFMGLFGTFANSLVIRVLRKRKKSTSFDTLLYSLAGFDLTLSLVTMISGTGIIFYLGNWDQSLFTLTYYHFTILIFFFGKTGSSIMTVAITVERYLVIAHPGSSRSWFTKKRTTIMVISLISLAVLFNIPRFSSIWIKYNYNGQNVPSLAGKNYIIYSTPLAEFWYGKLKSIHYVDVFLPFPLLIIFNVLLFRKIYQFIKLRKKLTHRQKSDIRAARMFVPVVVVLFLCNILPMTYYFVIRFYHVSYLELFFGMLLSVAVNSAANLPIYYARGGAFREELRNSLPEWLKPWFNKIPRRSGTELTVTVTGLTGEMTSDSEHNSRHNVRSEVVNSGVPEIS